MADPIWNALRARARVARDPGGIAGRVAAGLGRRAESESRQASRGGPADRAAPVASTNRLLNSAAQKPAPDDPADAHRHVAEFLPGFLVAVEAERPATSQKLEPGAPVPAGDRMPGIADLSAAVQRSMAEWESLLDQADADPLILFFAQRHSASPPAGNRVTARPFAGDGTAPGGAAHDQGEAYQDI